MDHITELDPGCRLAPMDGVSMTNAEIQQAIDFYAKQLASNALPRLRGQLEKQITALMKAQRLRACVVLCENPSND